MKRVWTESLSVGGTGILWAMSEGELYLHGDPSGQVPLFLLPSRLRRGVKLPRAKPVEPKAQYCAELLKHGLIEPMTADAESGIRRLQISKKGRDLLMRGHPA